MRSNRSKGPNPVVIVSAVFLVIAIVHLTKSDRNVSYYAAKGYVAHANALIDAGLIYYDCRTKRIEDRMGTLPPDHPDRRWFERSQLRADIGEFNRAPDASGRYFIVDACRLQEIHASIRNVRMPFSSAMQWMGAIRYSGEGGGATLRSRARSVTLADPDDPNRPWRASLVSLGAPLTQKVGAAILHFPDGPSARGAEVHFVGSEVVLRRKSQGDVRLLGYSVPPGRNMLLKPGDWIDFAEANGSSVETFQFLSDGPNLEASSVVIRNDRHERRFDPEANLGVLIDSQGSGGPVPLLANLVRDVNDSLNRIGASAASLQRGFDLKISIVRSLHARTSRILGETLERWKSAEHSPAGGVTVMNGQTGEILALATYPLPSDLAGTADVNVVDRARLLANQNFKLHPIGSAMKPFMFAAITNARPYLRSLVVEGHGPAGRQYSSLQCKFGDQVGSSYKLCAHPTAIDFETALEVSCNRYTVDLAMLALSRPVDGGGQGLRGHIAADPAWPDVPGGFPRGIQILGEPLSYVPDLGTFVMGSSRDGDRSCQQVMQLESLPYLSSLSEVTGVATYAGEDPAGTEKDLYERYRFSLYDVGLLSPLIDHLADAAPGVAVRRAFHGGWPETVNFGFNAMSQLRGDYVSFALGGASASWTNVQLAEALSRLVTGRRIQSKLVAVVPTDDTSGRSNSPALQDIALDASTREAVLRGMARVVSGKHGTARALQRSLREVSAGFPNHDVLVFSKTGTPTFVSVRESPAGVALRKLVQGGWLRLEAQQLVISSGPDRVPFASRGPQHARFSQSVRDVLQILSLDGDVSVVMHEIDAFGARWSAGVGSSPSGALTIAEGRLEINTQSPIFATQEKKRTARVYIMTLAVLPRNQHRSPDFVPTVAELRNPESHVLTTVIHLDVESGGNEAVRLARKLLPELAAHLRSMSSTPAHLPSHRS